ncbi:ATP-dependent Clp protease ATP-binding subunit [Vibrio phage vB_VpaM_R16F]|nr:ATP-dependent Clp protease ATP-binding subunit [Vibrio phage vB_VpaM_R16F]
MTQGFFFSSENVTQEDFDDFKAALLVHNVNVDPFNKIVNSQKHWVIYNIDGFNYFYGTNLDDRTLTCNYFYQKETFDDVRFNLFNILSQIEAYNNIDYDNYYSKYSLNDTYIINTVLGLTDSSRPKKKESTTMESVKTKPKFKFSEDVSKYLKDMRECAERADYGKVIGRESEVNLVIKTLSRYKKANPLLVGESGCGKTSIVEDLACKLVSGDKSIPESMKDMDLYEIDLTELSGGSKFRGDLEERISNIFKEVIKHGNCIVFMDEIHQIKNKSSETTPDVGNMLKPYLTNPKVKVIGATTYKEAKIIEKDQAINRRFQRIEVLEPSTEDTNLIVKGIKHIYEEVHGVKFSNKIIDYICELSGKYIHNQHSPDREIDILDLAGVETKHSNKKQVTVQVVEQVIANKTRISVDKIGKEATNLLDLNSEIKKHVFGQDEAIDELTNLIKIGMSGLKEQNKPIANLLFCGKTGVGKSQTVVSLAECLCLPILRLDMSEYSDRTAVNKLIGSSSGYVGYEEGGLLTEWLSRNPTGICLFDEIEKSDQSVFNLLLQMFDEGHITDNQGRKMMCNNHIIVMTSNVGVRQAEETNQGMGLVWESKEDKESETISTVLKQTFAPEFIARLDGICEFNTITDEVATLIINKFIKELSDRAGVGIKLSDEVVAKLIEDGFDAKMGARPLKSIIKKNITLQLADKIVSGDKVNNLLVCYEDNEYKLVEPEFA